MNYILMILYIIMSVTGSLLIKMASVKDSIVLLVVPGINFKVTLMTLLGISFYGCSFLLYIFLLSRLNLSFFTPVSTGCVYTLMMLSSIVLFHEKISVTNGIGIAVVLIGVLLVVMK